MQLFSVPAWGGDRGMQHGSLSLAVLRWGSEGTRLSPEEAEKGSGKLRGGGGIARLCGEKGTKDSLTTARGRGNPCGRPFLRMAATWDPPAYPPHRSSDRSASLLTDRTAAQGAPRARRTALPAGPLPGSAGAQAHLG